VSDRELLENERLKAALPYDWDMLEACRGSLREHMAEIQRLKADNERLRGLLAEAQKAVWMNYDSDLLDRIEAALKEVPR
jgi:hypothetical protein